MEGKAISESTKSIVHVEKKKPLSRRFAKQGLTTVGYTIGLLGAAAATMLLIRVLHDNLLFDTIMKWATDLFMNVTQYDS